MTPKRHSACQVGQLPAASILLPFHDAVNTLDECLDSIATQTFGDYEVLAVDDHSSDGSDRLVRRRGRDDGRIRLLRSPRRGLVTALNHGLSEARAGLVARMDADDIMHPERLERQFRAMTADEELVLLGCGAELFPAEAVQNGYREYMRWQNGCNSEEEIAREIYRESPFAHPGVMFRRDAVLGVGGYREGSFPEDYDLWLRLFRAGCRMRKLPETLLLWREYADRTSRRDPRYSREAFDRLRAEYLATDPRILRRRSELVFWGAGRKTRRRCSHLIGRGFAPIAWIDIDPRKIGNRLAGVPVVEPRWLAAQTRRPFVLIYVANHGSREEIAGDLEAMGFTAGRDYLQIG